MTLPPSNDGRSPRLFVVSETLHSPKIWEERQRRCGNRSNGIQLRQCSHVAKFDDLCAFRTFLRSIFTTELKCLASGFSFMLSNLVDKKILATLDSPTIVATFEPS